MKRWELLSLIESLQDAEIALVLMLKLPGVAPQLGTEARTQVHRALAYLFTLLPDCEPDQG